MTLFEMVLRSGLVFFILFVALNVTLILTEKHRED